MDSSINNLAELQFFIDECIWQNNYEKAFVMLIMCIGRLDHFDRDTLFIHCKNILLDKAKKST